MRNWKLRIICFLVALALLSWGFYDPPSEKGVLHSAISLMIPLGLACLFLYASDSEAYPEFLARSFTSVTHFGDKLQIRSTWLCPTICLAPVIPILIAAFLCGVFDHSFYPDSGRHVLLYTPIGYASLFFLIILLLLMPTGLRCTVTQNSIIWDRTYFGQIVRKRQYNNVRIIEYSLTNGQGGGPVLIIEYGEMGRVRKKSLKFQNLYRCSRENFGNILAEFLGEPERCTAIPTKRGTTPLLAKGKPIEKND